MNFLFRALLPTLVLIFSLNAQAAVYDDMMIAVKLGDKGTVIELLNRGMDANTSDMEGNTLLMIAARAGYLELVELFIAERAKLDARNMHGDSALSLAALEGRFAVARRLVEAGAQVNSEGWPPLAYAAFNGHAQMVDYLLAHGANVNATSENGVTALMMAARGGYLAIVQRLVAARANIHLQTDRGKTALDWALENRHTHIAEFLRHQGEQGSKIEDLGSERE
ncbi:MAG: ankyrin repeat domain-containing protein [Zoogloeaceae bacterium]|jgi:ankyrin repeat protein|nr:ankyrin repeat domain-containing protein [Zoogloeaceae bacterium]